MRPTLLNPLFAPVTSLSGIGPKLSIALTRLLRGNTDGGEQADVLDRPRGDELGVERDSGRDADGVGVD